MPRGIQNVDPLALEVKLHDGGRDGDPPLLFDLHPVGLSEVPGLPGLDCPGFPDNASEEEELFGDRGLPGIGVRNDRKGPSLVYCFSEFFS